MKFTAMYLEPRKDVSVANVLFADPETNPDEPLVMLFSRAIDIADSSYYFEINDQSYGSYGGLKSVRLSRGSLEAHLEPEVVKKFGKKNFARVEIEFDIDDETYEAVVEVLSEIFAGDKVLVLE